MWIFVSGRLLQNGNGVLSKDEIRGVLYSMGEQVSEERLTDMFNGIDIDGDGQVDFSEFVVFMRKHFDMRERVEDVTAVLESLAGGRLLTWDLLVCAFFSGLFFCIWCCLPLLQDLCHGRQSTSISLLACLCVCLCVCVL